MIYAGYVSRIGGTRNTYSIFVGKREGQRHLEDLCVDGKDNNTIYFGERVGGCGLESSG
jgi:hypothetical protein